MIMNVTENMEGNGTGTGNVTGADIVSERGVLFFHLKSYVGFLNWWTMASRILLDLNLIIWLLWDVTIGCYFSLKVFLAGKAFLMDFHLYEEDTAWLLTLIAKLWCEERCSMLARFKMGVGKLKVKMFFGIDYYYRQPLSHFYLVFDRPAF